MHQHPLELDRPHHARYAGGPLGAGENFVWTPPERTYVELLSVQMVLTTAPGGATREMFLYVGGPGDDDFALQFPVTQAGGTTYTYWLGRGMGSYWTMSTDVYTCGPLPEGLLFQAPEQLRTDILGILGGDVITHYAIRYRLWQDPDLV